MRALLQAIGLALLLAGVGRAGDVLHIRTTSCDRGRCVYLYGTAFSIGTLDGKQIVLTAGHNLPRGHGPVVIQKDGAFHQARRVYSHAEYDIAIVELAGVEVEPFCLARTSPAVGARVRAAGFPNRRQWVADGVRSRRQLSGGGLYAISIPTTYGASGGPIVSDGKVVGLISIYVPALQVSGVVGSEALHATVMERYGRLPDCNSLWARSEPPRRTLQPTKCCDCEQLDQRLSVLEQRQTTVVNLIESHDERLALAEQQITELSAELERLRNTPLKVEHYRAGSLIESGAVRFFDGEPLQFNFSKRN